MNSSREILEHEEDLEDERAAADLERVHMIEVINQVGPAHPRRLIRTHDWIQDDQEDDES